MLHASTSEHHPGHLACKNSVDSEESLYPGSESQRDERAKKPAKKVRKAAEDGISYLWDL